MLLRTGKTPSGAEIAGHVRQLILHAAAYWLMWTVRQALPETTALRVAELATIRLRLINVAARIIETTSRVRIALASACPDADIFRHIARALKPAPA